MAAQLALNCETRIATHNRPQAIAAAALDAGAGMDLVVGHKDGGGLTVLFGDGGRELGAALDIEVGEDPIAIATGDINADSRADIVVAHAKDFSVHLLLGDGTGTFVTSAVTIGHEMGGVALGDLDEDGIPEIVVTLPKAKQVAVLMSQP